MNRGICVLILLIFFVIVSSSVSSESPVFGDGQSRGFVQNKELKEASGLTASLYNPGLLWSHNDSGDEARIFLLDDSAKNKAVYHLEGIKAQDWEEIASFKKDRNYLLIGDIGDNKGIRPFISLHLFEEPKYKRGAFYIDTIPAKRIISFTLTYEDGPRDAEAFFYDEHDQKLYIISKRELEVGLYETKLPLHVDRFAAKDTLELKKSAILPFTFITSAAISNDGSEVLLKNLLTVFYWKRKDKETIPDMLKRPAIRLPYKPEIQGEAMTFALDGTGYYTLSEAPFGFKAELFFYPRLKSTF